MRTEVQELASLGPFPDSATAEEEQLKRYETLLNSMMTPVSDAEARGLVRLFGPDECYGLAWTLLHLIETAPGWPLLDCLQDNPWHERLRHRAERRTHGAEAGAKTTRLA